MVSAETAQMCLSLLDVATIKATEDAIAAVTKAREELRAVIADGATEVSE